MAIKPKGIMATKKTNAKSAQGAQKANGTTNTRKGATKGAEKSAAKGKKTAKAKKPAEVVERLECADLELYTKETEMQLGQTRRGKLLKRGRYDYKFVENGIAEQKNGRPWEVRVKLAEEKPYARISANSNGGFLTVYVPKENFGSTRELVEIFLDQTERLCEKVEDLDAVAIIEKLNELKSELLEACV